MPGGVGPVTVAMFMRNPLTAHDSQLVAGPARLRLLIKEVYSLYLAAWAADQHGAQKAEFSERRNPTRADERATRFASAWAWT